MGTGFPPYLLCDFLARLCRANLTAGAFLAVGGLFHSPLPQTQAIVESALNHEVAGFERSLT